MLRVTDAITLDDREIRERFVRASGPGGQNMNQEATAVELRFNIKASALPPDVKARLIAIAGRNVVSNGVLMVVSRARRSQAENRNTAHARLVALLQRAAKPPKVRKPTRPRAAERERRLSAKKILAAVKRSRSGREDD